MQTATQPVGQALELVEAPPAANVVPINTPATPMHMLQLAVERGMPLDYIERLMTLQERHEQNEARRAYNEAMAGFKAEHVVVVRNRTRTDGPLKGQKYADLFAVTDAAVEKLSKYGLSHSFRVLEDKPDWIRLACVIKHRSGHSEEVAFGGPIDTGPARNALQARKSTLTQLERVLLTMALGLADTESDDDGQAGGGAAGGAAASDNLVSIGNDKALGGTKALNDWWGTMSGKQKNEVGRAFYAMRRTAVVADSGGADE